MKKLLSLLTHRVTFVVLFMLVQLFAMFAMTWWFNRYFVVFYTLSIIVAMLIVLYIINNRDHPAYKIAWIVPVLLLPLFGGLVYLLFSHSGLTLREKKKMYRIYERMQEWNATQPGQQRIAALKHSNPQAAVQSCYMMEHAFCPPCQNTYTRYYPLGELAFERMKEAIRAAERYVFLEYFIVQEGVMWNELRDLLVQKVREGVDVRLIYDDMGCIFTLPYRYDRKLESLGIKCCVFNPFQPVLSSRFNNRSHRKLMLVDGHTAFTGGINLADEYINAYEKHGHWKDTVIEVQGEAAWAMTVNFLTMWDYHRSGPEEEIEKFHPAVAFEQFADEPGYVQPYADSPLDGEPVGESVYMNLLTRATRYVYITTPYLIIGNEMVTALCNVAKSGVDVRIITPHAADKWYVHAVTRHNYLQLTESGVRILEYTPGFIHAKSFVVDDEYAVVGTVNLDYRSLYLHFENGVWMYGARAVAEIYEDFRRTERLCTEITVEDCRATPLPVKLGRSLLNLFAPLM